MASKDPYPPKNIASDVKRPQITHVYESSSPDEINELLDAGATFLGVAVRKTESGEMFVYSVGIPDQITDLPRWGVLIGSSHSRMVR